MSLTRILISSVFVVSFSVAAFADDERPPADALPLSDIVKILEEKGYDPIVEANFDDGMWEVEAYKDGKRWELIINRDSGKIMNEWIDN